MLQVSNVSKIYPTPRGPLSVLSDVSFTLSPGEAAAITGTIRQRQEFAALHLGALEPPSIWDGHLGRPRSVRAVRRAGWPKFRNAEIGFVFQDHCLLPQCSVLENVLIPTLVR